MSELTLDHVARYPAPGTVMPGAISFSPDGELLTYLKAKEDSLSRVLWARDISTGETRILFEPETSESEENLSPEQKLRRERMRMMHVGVTSYEWARDVPVLLVPILQDLWVVSEGQREVVGSNALDPHLSPDGRRIAFVRDGELWSLEISTKTERRLTFAPEPGITNGIAEYAAQEEMARYRGFWWSRDSRLLAFEEVDERHIPVFRIPHWGLDQPYEEEHRYPFAGGPNAKVRLGVVNAEGGEVRWMDLGDAEYLTRVSWHPDGRLFVQIMNRDQTHAELRAYDPSSGDHTVMLTEESEIWVNLNNDLRFVDDTGEFVWASERTGSKQLYLYAPDGSEHRAITSLPWPVDAVEGVDAASRSVVFSGSPNPIETHLFRVGLDGGEPEMLSEPGGTTAAVISPDLSMRAEIRHSSARPPSVTLITGKGPEPIHEPARIELDLIDPEFFSFTSRDGEELHGYLLRPAVVPAPLIVHTYGGPHAQMVADSWGSRISMQAQYLASRGFAVMTVDNRGSARRGLEFEGALLRRMGSIEVDDQVDGVRHAIAQGWADPDRIGVTGWSYGGYMTLMCMLKEPDVFKAGVAGAPVSAWDGYDTFYTERYMRRPQDNPDGYRDGSALAHAAALRGDLLIVHGMIDENVHFRHTARFLDALQKAGRSCETLIYPQERHSPRSEADRRNMHERIVRFFETHLG